MIDQISDKLSILFKLTNKCSTAYVLIEIALCSGSKLASQLLSNCIVANKFNSTLMTWPSIKAIGSKDYPPAKN